MARPEQRTPGERPTSSTDQSLDSYKCQQAVAFGFYSQLANDRPALSSSCTTPLRQAIHALTEEIDENDRETLREQIGRFPDFDANGYAQMMEVRVGVEGDFHGFFLSCAQRALENSAYEPWCNAGMMLAKYLTGLHVVTKGPRDAELPDLTSMFTEGFALPEMGQGTDSLLTRIAMMRPRGRNASEWLEVLPPTLRTRYHEEYAFDDTGWPLCVFDYVTSELAEHLQGHVTVQTQERVIVQPESYRYLFRHDGAVFRVRFGRETGSIDARLLGARYVFELLQHPHRQYSATDLASRVLSTDQPDEHGIEKNLENCRDRLQTIQDEIGRAKTNNDTAELIRLQTEKDEINTEVKRLLSDRRRPNPQSEKARVAVRNAIKRVINKCATEYNLPRFSQHIDTHISTGGQCAYLPSKPAPDWHF